MSINAQARLFQPFDLGPITLANRVVMAPLTRSRSDRDGIPPAYAADYYAQRASAGLIISEATNISPQAVGYAMTPGIWSEAQVQGWKPVTAAVHARGGRIFMQLWHTGRISHPDLQPHGALPVAPSALRPEGQAFTYEGLKDHVAPRALEGSELPGIVEDYRRAARNALAAGFDGVEVHAANNYLLEQFIRDSTNRREDAYGGSIENRLRLPLEVVRAVVEVCGAERVGIRLSPSTTVPGNTPLDSSPMQTYGRLIDELSALRLAYLHVIEGVTRSTREHPQEIDFDALRTRFDGPFMANNRFTGELAEQELEAGRADLISFGRPFIANPDLVERLRRGAPLAEAPQETYYGGDQRGYSDWPTLDTEAAADA